MSTEEVDERRALPCRVGDVLLEKYVVERELGRGGMGYVVAARHRDLGELVAIKMILSEHAQNGEMVVRFMREARAAAQIASEHVVRVMDVGRLPTNEPYMVMELLKGEDLEQILAERGPLDMREAVDLLLQVAEAVAEAHAAGIVHRDLKPANLYVTTRRNGTPCVKVLDFGISKLTGEAPGNDWGMTQGILGSPLYMSPEQLRASADIDGRADIWSLGVILFQMLSLEFPFMSDGLPQLIAKVLDAPCASLRALRPDLPAALEQAVARCLEKDRNLRYASVAELANELAPFGTSASQSSLSAVANALGSSPRTASSPRLPSAASAGASDARALPSHASTLGPLDASGSIPPDLGSSPRRDRRMARVVVALAFASVAGISIGGIALRSKTPTLMSQTGANATQPELPSSETGAPVTEPSARPLPPVLASAQTAAPTAPRAPDAASVPAPMRPVAPSLGRKPTAVPSTSASPTSAPNVAVPSPNCSPPYRVSASGAHVPKPECL